MGQNRVVWDRTEWYGTGQGGMRQDRVVWDRTGYRVGGM